MIYFLFLFKLSSVCPGERANGMYVRVCVTLLCRLRLASSLSWHLGLFLDFGLLEGTRTCRESGHTQTHNKYTHRWKDMHVHLNKVFAASVRSVSHSDRAASVNPSSGHLSLTHTPTSQWGSQMIISLFSSLSILCHISPTYSVVSFFPSLCDIKMETGQKEGGWEWLKPITVALSRDLCWPKLITDEQPTNNTLLRDSWMRSIHYSLDSSQPSQSFPPALPWFVSQFLPFHESFFTSPVILPFVYSLFVSPFIFIFLDTRHFPSLGHTATRVRRSLGTLSMQPWYRCPKASQTADITALWACEGIPLTL